MPTIGYTMYTYFEIHNMNLTVLCGGSYGNRRFGRVLVEHFFDRTSLSENFTVKSVREMFAEIRDFMLCILQCENLFGQKAFEISYEHLTRGKKRIKKFIKNS